jgi:phosphotriesterase-related protein
MTGAATRGQAQTVTGPIEARLLGATHSHEHLAAHATPELLREDVDLALDDPERVKPDLLAFREAGGGAIVEMTTVDYGRDAAALLRLSRETGVRVIAATGFNKGKYCRPFTEGKDPTEIARHLVEEVTEGIGDTGVRAGVIKAATSLNEVEPWEEVALRAAARAHLETGCPITTHTEAGTMPEEQLEIFAEEGVGPENVVLCHLDRNPDLELHRRLADEGAFLSYDQLPKPKYGTEVKAIEIIAALAREGLHRQVLVGGDLVRRSYFVGWGGSPGLAYLLTGFREKLTRALREAGLPADGVVRDVFENNPARAFGFR